MLVSQSPPTIAAMPGTLSNGYKMVFYTLTGVDSYISYDKVSIKRGVFGSIADVDKDLEFDDNTSWERQLNKGLFSNANLNDDNCISANNNYYPVSGKIVLFARPHHKYFFLSIRINGFLLSMSMYSLRMILRIYS